MSLSSSCTDDSCQSGSLQASVVHAGSAYINSAGSSSQPQPQQSQSQSPPLTKIVVYGVIPSTTGQQFELSVSHSSFNVKAVAVHNSTHAFVVFTGLRLSIVDDFQISWKPSTPANSDSARTAVPVVGVVFLCLAGFGVMLAGMVLIHKREFSLIK